MIELRDIEKTYRICDIEYPVLMGIDFNIEQGEFIALMGPSGTGKSTLMNIVGCWAGRQEANFCYWTKMLVSLGYDELAQIRREELGFIFQTFNLIGRNLRLD